MLALTLCQKKDDTSLKWQWRKGRAQSQKVTDKSIEEDAKERKEKKDHAKDSRTNGSRRNGRRKEDATKESKGKDSLLRHNAKTLRETTNNLMSLKEKWEEYTEEVQEVIRLKGKEREVNKRKQRRQC